MRRRGVRRILPLVIAGTMPVAAFAQTQAQARAPLRSYVCEPPVAAGILPMDESGAGK